MLVRSLTRLLTPVSGETIASYTDRLAARHTVPRLVILKWLGLLEDERHQPIPGFGVVLDETSMERFSIATSLPKSTISEMLLSAYDGISLDLSKTTFKAQYLRENRGPPVWAYFSGSNACPHCLKEDEGAWQLAWKLPWTFTCVKHKCYLVSHCPVCGLRLAQGRGSGLLSPPWVQLVPRPGHCTNPNPGNKVGRHGSPCNYELTSLRTEEASLATLFVQRDLNEYLKGRAATILGDRVSSLEYFRNLQAVYAFILYCGELDDFHALSPSEAVAFKKFSDKRDDLTPRPASTLSAQGKRKHLLNPHHDSPELIAGVTRLAMTILRAENETSMAVLLRRMTDRFFTLRNDRWQFIGRFGFGERISTVFAKNMAPTSTFNRAIGRKAATTREIQIAFGPQHVPALLWKESFDTRFAKFFPSSRGNAARHYCAMALIKVCSDYTWAQSAVEIGLTAHYAKPIARRYANLLRKNGSLEEFGRTLHTLARNLSNDPYKIDYAARRDILSNTIEIPDEDWAQICKTAGIRVGQSGVRSKYAAAWLWAVLTGSDWHLAPSFAKGKLSKSAAISYRQYSKTIFTKVAPHLLAYGHQQLKAHFVR